MEKEARVNPRELDLIREIRDGNYNQFEQLISTYQNRLGAFIYRLVGEEDEVKDLVQETFIKAYKGLKSFKGSTWLFRIGYNLSIDFLNSRRKDQELAGELTKTDAHLIQNGAKILENEQVHNQINDLINRLPEKYKTVLHLFYRETKNYSDIAQIINSPLNSVKSLLRRGKNMVKEGLKKKYNIKVLQE